MMRQPPYADFAIWFAVRQEALEDAKVQVLRDDARRLLQLTRMVAGACLFSTLAVELQGPANHVGDDGSGGASKLDAVGEQDRDAEPPLRKLLASDSGGRRQREEGSKWPKRFSKVKMAIDAWNPPPRGWDPWTNRGRWYGGLVLNDQDYWREQVHLPAMVWMAKGSKGVQPCPPTRRSSKERGEGRRKKARTQFLGGDASRDPVRKLNNRAEEGSSRRENGQQRQRGS